LSGVPPATSRQAGANQQGRSAVAMPDLPRLEESCRIYKGETMKDDDDIQEYVRPWKGLTEDEVFALSNTMPYANRFEFAKAIEAKLKEKNT